MADFAKFQHEKIITHTPSDVFAIFKREFQKTFPEGDVNHPLGAITEREAPGAGGNIFRLSMHISDYREEEVYELTTQASNRQTFITRYELFPAEGGNTRLVLTEKNTTPGFFGSGNALLTQIIFKRKASKKAERLFQAIENELAK